MADKLHMPVICECGFSTMDAKKAVEHAMMHERADVEKLRKEFERRRRQKIEAVAHKHKDDSLDFEECLAHLRDEMRELELARKYLLITGDDDLVKRIEEELIDVANCAEFTFIALRKHKDCIKRGHR